MNRAYLGVTASHLSAKTKSQASEELVEGDSMLCWIPESNREYIIHI